MPANHRPNSALNSDPEITGKGLLLGLVMVATGIAMDLLAVHLSFAQIRVETWLLLVAWHVGGTLTGAGLAMPFGNKWVLLIGALVGLAFVASLLAISVIFYWYII